MQLETRMPELTAADRAWFGEQIEALLPDLFGTAVRLCGNRADAEDLVALAVSKAWEALPSLEDRDAFRGWIFRILNNAFVSDCRSARAQATRESIDASPSSPSRCSSGSISRSSSGRASPRSSSSTSCWRKTSRRRSPDCPRSSDRWP